MNKIELSDSHKIKIRFSDTDAMAVVWHGNYLKYFEDGRESFGKAFGLDYLLFAENRVFAPVVKVSCDFKFPLYYGQEANIITKFINSDAAKMIFHYEIRDSQSNNQIVIGETLQVFTSFDRELLLTPPHFFLDWKNRYFGDDN